MHYTSNAAIQYFTSVTRISSRVDNAIIDIMKILITSDLYPPVINGVATFSQNLARGLVAAGHEVLVIAPSQDGKRSVEYDGDIPIHRVRSVIFPFYQNIRICVAPQLEVRNILQEFKPDIIHNQMPLAIGQATTMIARRHDTPIVSTSHAMPENLMDNLSKLSAFSKPFNYMLADFGRRYHSKSDAVTSPTKSGIDGFAKFTSKLDAPLYVISNGINLNEYSPGEVREELYDTYHLPTDKPIITYLGRLDAEKHVWVLLKAMKKILETHDVHMMIVGSGVDLENSEQLAEELGIDEHVTFTGRVPEEDKAELHRIGTLFAVASPAELQCIAALEAMASGQPVVAVDAGALSELCHDGENGYLFDLDDYDMAAEKIIAVLDDESLREEFSQESLAIARSHNLDFTIEQFVALYEAVIEKKAEEIAARPSGWRDRILESEFVEYIRAVRSSDDEELSAMTDEEIKKL